MTYDSAIYSAYWFLIHPVSTLITVTLLARPFTYTRIVSDICSTVTLNTHATTRRRDEACCLEERSLKIAEDMDFEKEMQRSLKVIYQNIQALAEHRNEVKGKVHDSVLKTKRQRSGSLPGEKTCHPAGFPAKREGMTTRLKHKNSL